MKTVEKVSIEKEEEFKEFLKTYGKKGGLSSNTCDSYMSYLRRVTNAIGQEIRIDQINSGDQLEEVLLALRPMLDDKDFNDSRSALRAYRAFASGQIRSNTRNRKSIGKVWRDYTRAIQSFKQEFNITTSNILGSIGEQIASQFYNAQLSTGSNPGYDFISDGKRFQVKTVTLRERSNCTSLSAIRTSSSVEESTRNGEVFRFDFLIVIIFSSDGRLFEVRRIPALDLEQYALMANKKKNSYINAYAFTTTKDFLALGTSIKDEISQQFDLEVV